MGWKTNKRLWIKFLLIAAFALSILAISYLKYFPQQVERYYSNGIYPAISGILQAGLNFLPFSFGDLAYALFCVLILFFSIKILRFLSVKNFKASAHLLLNMVIGLQAFIIVFYLFWGINYFRQPAAQRLNLPDTGYTTTDLQQITAMLIDSANALRKNLSQTELQFSDQDVERISEQAILSLSKTNGFPSFDPEIKPSLFSSLLSYAGTAGYYNPFTAEAQLNNQIPGFLKPVVACHEMSHQTGFAAEDEANFAGFLAGISSGNKLLKYSAYYLGVAECMGDLRRRDSVAHKELKSCISGLVLTDFKTDSDYWMKHQSRAGTITNVLFDTYLKANNQPEGLRRYNMMVKLTIAWYRKKGILKTSFLYSRIDEFNTGQKQ